MRPRVAPWFRRQFPDVIETIYREPGAELVSVGHPVWSGPWLCSIYAPRPWPDTPLHIADGEGRSPVEAFRSALRAREEVAA